MSQLILIPKISEKAMYLADRGIYTFDVPTSTNKIEVAKAVESTFKVNVTDVNMVITKGKVKTFKGKPGRERDIKKAMVKLKSGQTIKLFEGSN